MSVPEAESMVLDFDGWLGQQPAPDRAGIEEHLRTVDAGNRDLEKKRLASMFAVADATHLDLPTVNDQWETVRGGFAEQKGKDWLAVKDDEGAFYDRLKTSLTQQRDERHLLAGLDDQRAPNAQQAWDASLVHQAAEAGYAGKSYADALSAWQEVAKGKPGYDPERASVYEETAQKAHADMAATVGKVRPIAQQVYSSLAQERDVQGGAPVAAPAVLLRGLTPDEKDVAFRMVGDMSNAPGGKGRAEAFGEALGRSFENLGVGGGSAALRDQLLQHEFHAGETVTEPNAAAQVRALYGVETAEKATGGGPGAGAASLGAAFSSRNGRQLTADEAAQWNKDLGTAVEDLDTAERARKFGQEKVDPTTAGGWFFRKAVMPVAESAALMAAMEIPGAWAPSIELTARGFQDDEYARLRALGMTAAQANQRAALVGAAQAASFKLTATLLGKTALPATSAVLRKFGGEVTADALEGFAFNGSTAARYAANTAEGVVSGTVLMTLQNHVIPAMVQDLTTNDPRFDVNWSDVWSEAGKALPDTMLGMVLLAGTGALLKTSQQTQDAKALRDYTGSKAAMRLNGYSLEQIDQIQAAPIQERADMLRALAPKTAPTGEAKAEVVADAVRLAREEQAAFEAKRQNETAGATEAADYAVRVTRDAGGWKVLQANGKTVDASSADAARVIRDHLRQVNSQAEGDALVAIVDNWHAKTPEGTQRETTITGETARADAQGITYSRDGKVTRENTDAKTLDNLHKEAQMDAQLSGNEGIDVIVNGSNSVEFREKVGEGAAQVVQRLELNQSESTALTALHEQAEAAWRTGIARGAITLEETTRAIAAVAGALDPAQARTAEEKAFRERVQRVAAGKGSDIEVRETVSELAVADAIGRRRDGSAMPAGAVTTSLDAAIRNAVDAGEAKTLGKFRAFLRAAKQYFRGVLGTVAALKKARKGGGAEEFDKLISKITGLDEQGSHDTKLAADLTDIEKSAPDYVPPTPEEEAAGIAFSLKPVTDAYKKLAEETGFPAVSIGHLAEKGKVPLEELKADILKEWKAGNVVLSQGDWSHADEATRAGAVMAAGDRYLQVRWLDSGAAPTLSKGMPEKDAERVVGTAVLLSDGSIVRGEHPNSIHASIIRGIEGGADLPAGVSVADDGGFISSTGRFLTREEATKLSGAGIKSLGAEHLARSGKLSPASIGKQREYDAARASDIRERLSRNGWDAARIDAHLRSIGLDPAFRLSPGKRLELIQNRIDAALAKDPARRRELQQRASEKLHSVIASQEMQAQLGKEQTPKTRLVNDMRTLDAVLSVFPPEVRAKVGGFVKLAEFSTDEARSREILRRVDKLSGILETHLRKEYGAALDNLFERAKPKVEGPGKKPVGKAGADIHSLFDTLQQAVDWSPEGAEDHITTLEAELARGTATPQREAHIQQEIGLVRLVADWANADAARRATAVDEATRVFDEGYAKYSLEKLRQSIARDRRREELSADTGKAGTAPERDDRMLKDNGLAAGWKKTVLNLANFEQVLKYAFGDKSKQAERIADMEREASYAKTDETQATEHAVSDLFTKLAGSEFKGQKLRYDLAQKKLEVGERKLSELEAISATLMWRQEDGRRHMEGKTDDGGNVISKWHYDQDFIDEIEGKLSAEAKAVRAHIAAAYSAEYPVLNEVYRKLNGIDLPSHKNYAPITVKPGLVQMGQTIDPITGTSFSAASTTPGSLKSRGSAIAEPEFRDALQVFLAHSKQMAHWKAYAPLLSEAKSLLGTRDISNSVTVAAGDEAAKVMHGWLDYFAQGGTREAGAHLELNKKISQLTGRAASVALVGRLGTIAVQATQLGAAIAEMPTGAYLNRMGRLLSGNLGWGDAINSPYIQRRIKEMPVIVREAVEGLKSTKPNLLRHNVQKLGKLIGGADAIFTAGTYAMVRDYQLGQAHALGLTGAEAEAHATQAAERATDNLAQPTRPGARSLFENTATSPFVRIMWAFASESRKNLGLMAYAVANRPVAEALRTVMYVAVINTVASAMIRSAWRDAKNDDDSEVFDDKNWNLTRLALTAATEPIQGFPVFGPMAQDAIYKMAGQYHPEGTILSGGEQAAGALTHLPDILTGEQGAAQNLKDAESMLTGLGLFNDNIAAAASLSHLARDLYGVAQNVLPDSEAQAAHKEKLQAAAERRAENNTPEKKQLRKERKAAKQN